MGERIIEEWVTAKTLPLNGACLYLFYKTIYGCNKIKGWFATAVSFRKFPVPNATLGNKHMQAHISWLTHYRAASLSASDPTFSSKCPMAGSTADQRLVRIQFRQSSGFAPDSASDKGQKHLAEHLHFISHYGFWHYCIMQLYLKITKCQYPILNFNIEFKLQTLS